MISIIVTILLYLLGKRNELKFKKHELKKDKYFVYRVYKIKTDHPQFYIMNYNEFKNNIALIVNGYMSTLKSE